MNSSPRSFVRPLCYCLSAVFATTAFATVIVNPATVSLTAYATGGGSDSDNFTGSNTSIVSATVSAFDAHQGIWGSLGQAESFGWGIAGSDIMYPGGILLHGFADTRAKAEAYAGRPDQYSYFSASATAYATASISQGVTFTGTAWSYEFWGYKSTTVGYLSLGFDNLLFFDQGYVHTTGTTMALGGSGVGGSTTAHASAGTTRESDSVHLQETSFEYFLLLKAPDAESPSLAFAPSWEHLQPPASVPDSGSTGSVLCLGLISLLAVSRSLNGVARSVCAMQQRR
jgi:hypothetical protein